jgi:hypothetical protein
MPGDFHCRAAPGYAFLKSANLAHLKIPLPSPFLLTLHSSVGQYIRKGNYITYMRYEVLMAIAMKNTIFRDVYPYIFQDVTPCIRAKV